MLTLWDSTPTDFTLEKWHAEFQKGKTSCDDMHCHGHPKTSVEKCQKPVMDDQRLSVSFIADCVGISNGRVHSVLAENLFTRKVSERRVPQMFSDI